jgi:hypothetical protein
MTSSQSTKTTMKLFLVALLLAFIALISAGPTNCAGSASGNAVAVLDQDDVLSFEEEVLEATTLKTHKYVRQNTGRSSHARGSNGGSKRIEPTQRTQQGHSNNRANKPNPMKIRWNQKLSSKLLGKKYGQAIASGILSGKETIKDLAQFGLFEKTKDTLKKCLVGSMQYFCYLDCNTDVNACTKPDKVLAMAVSMKDHEELCAAPRIDAFIKEKQSGLSESDDSECKYRPCSCRVFEKKMMEENLDLYKTRVTLFQSTCTDWCDSRRPPLFGIPYQVAEHYITRWKAQKLFATFKPEAATFDDPVKTRGEIPPQKLSFYFKFWTPFHVTKISSYAKGITHFFDKIKRFPEFIQKL